MSNLGLESALERDGIRMVRTPVGDKYVLEEMVRLGAVLGGEQSGHVIFREFATTGDGLLTALRVLEMARDAGAGLDELTAGLRDLSAAAGERARAGEEGAHGSARGGARDRAVRSRRSAGAGRVLVRFSGTEPLARVMVEGPDLDQVERCSRKIADAIRREMGA